MDELGQLLIEKKISICSIESFTVGTFASRLGQISGISKVYKGSAVTYQSIIKEKLLHIDHELIERYGVVSSEIAFEMAKNGQKLFESDLAISFTGNAGPTAMEGKPVGLIYIGVATKQGIDVFEYHLQGTREDIVNQAIQQGIDTLIEKIK